MDQAEIDRITSEHLEMILNVCRRTCATNKLQPPDVEVCEIDFELHMRQSSRLASWASTHFSPGWLSSCAQNFVMNYRRGLDTISNHEQDGSAVQAEASSRASQEHGPDQKAQATEIELELRVALAVLPENQRVMITMHHSEQRTHAEIAEELGTTPEAVRKRIMRGLLIVRSQLEHSEFEWREAMRILESKLPRM